MYVNMHLHKHEGAIPDTVFTEIKEQQIISLG